MSPAENPTTRPTPQSIAGHVKRQAASAKKVLTASHDHGPAETVREVDYNGHHIVIGTTYRIEVDGRRVGGHFVVTDEGEVQCHALPNYTFASAVDLVKSMIDIFPEDFPATGGGGQDGPGDSHDHGPRDHGTHGSPASRAPKPGKPAKRSASSRKAGKGSPKGGHRGRH